MFYFRTIIAYYIQLCQISIMGVSPHCPFIINLTHVGTCYTCNFYYNYLSAAIQFNVRIIIQLVYVYKIT